MRTVQPRGRTVRLPRHQLLLLGLLVVLGCGDRGKPAATVTANALSPIAEETLGSAVDLLRRTADLESCRNAIQSANLYFNLHEADRPRELTSQEREVLKRDFSLEDGELAEIDNRSFTLLDAHYLECCFLLRNATRALKIEQLPPLEQAAAGFAWVMRQVRLRERPASSQGAGDQPPADCVPPTFALRRGWGSAQERALVFLALLDQLGIGGCMVMVPGASQGQNAMRPWLPGALVGKEIYLFDTRLGLPLPGPEGKGIATLAQVRTQPEILRILEVDPQSPYDVTPESAKQAEARVACQLSALAPRMLLLQEALSSGGDKINLWTDPVALLKKHRDALEGKAFAGSKLTIWNNPSDKNNSLRVLRTYLPKDEGGVDSGQRIQLSIAQLIPTRYFPPLVQDLGGEVGERLRQIYVTPFIYFGTKTRMPHEVMAAWLPGLAVDPNQQGGGQDAGHRERAAPELIQRGRLPRDLVLNGRFDEATTLLVAIRGELQRQKGVGQAPGLGQVAEEWRKMVVSASSAVLQAQERTKRGKDADSLAAVAAAKENLNQVWSRSQPMMLLIQAAAAEPMLDLVTYQLALCKHEQAEQAQAKLALAGKQGKSASPAEQKASQDAWKAAASWWQTYLEEQRSSIDAAAARRQRARALEALGDRAAAIAVLEEQSSGTVPFDRIACLYLSKRLK